VTLQDQRRTVSAAAISRHVASMRRQRRWYVAVIGLIALVVGGWGTIVWSHSEIVHATLHSAKAAPPDVPGGQLSATPQLAWRSEERTATGTPFEGGTVITYSTHTVHGRDARTGAITWSYTRTDRTICEVVQAQNRTVAFFRHNGNCDELDAFTTDTGKRAWDRTLDTEAHPVNGQPKVLARADGLFVSTDAVLYAIRLNEGYDFWEYAVPGGCRGTGLAIGSAGALIAESCTDGNHLLLRDRYASNDAKDHPVKWQLDKVTALPFAADSFVAALDSATHQLVRYDPKSGHVAGRLALTPPPSTTEAVQQTPAKDAELAWTAGTTYAVDPGGARQLWSASTTTLPTVAPSVATLGLPSLTSSVVLVASPGGVDLLDGATGRVSLTLPVVPPPPAGSRVFAVGTGFVLAGSSTIVYK
jgi:outer membrane protein assembly factor BamB